MASGCSSLEFISRWQWTSLNAAHCADSRFYLFRLYVSKVPTSEPAKPSETVSPLPLQREESPFPGLGTMLQVIVVFCFLLLCCCIPMFSFDYSPHMQMHICSFHSVVWRSQQVLDDQPAILPHQLDLTALQLRKTRHGKVN